MKRKNYIFNLESKYELTIALVMSLTFLTYLIAFLWFSLDLSPDKHTEIPNKRNDICQFSHDKSPEMVTLKGNHTYIRRYLLSKTNRAQTKVTDMVAIQPFAISRCEITIAQFNQFITETGYKASEWDALTNQPQQHPMTEVSWMDANAYVRWLKQRTGLGYRLPTESEWAYASKDTSRYTCEQVNSKDGKCLDEYFYVAPVASFKENDKGLYDMKGNVAEWVADCQNESVFVTPPKDGSAVVDNAECSKRITRGGSWDTGDFIYDTPIREAVGINVKSSRIGFRVARTL